MPWDESRVHLALEELDCVNNQDCREAQPQDHGALPAGTKPKALAGKGASGSHDDDRWDPSAAQHILRTPDERVIH